MEGLVAFILVGLIGTIILQVLVPMARGTVRGTQQVELQQVGSLALKKVCAEMQSTAIAGIVTSPSSPTEPFLMSIHPLRTVDSIGDQVWGDQLIVYWWKQDEGKLWRTTWPHGPVSGRAPVTDAPFRPTVAELKTIVGASDDRWRRVVANQVSLFDVNLTAFPARVLLTVEAPAPDSRPPEKFELTRRVAFRNERL